MRGYCVSVCPFSDGLFDGLFLGFVLGLVEVPEPWQRFTANPASNLVGQSHGSRPAYAARFDCPHHVCKSIKSLAELLLSRLDSVKLETKKTVRCDEINWPWNAQARS